MLNLDGELSPGMFVRARVLSEVSGALSVPESAVLQSGRRDVVLVAEGGGRFRPTIVTLGRRYLSSAPPADGEVVPFGAEDERFHEVVEGLQPGDRVVVAATFLLNAEAQTQGVLKKMLEATDLEPPPPPLPDELRAQLDKILNSYFEIGRALVADDPSAVPTPADVIRRVAQVFRGPAEAVDGRYGQLADAALSLAAALPANDFDFQVARTRYAELSREVIAYPPRRRAWPGVGGRAVRVLLQHGGRSRLRVRLRVLGPGHRRNRQPLHGAVDAAVRSAEHAELSGPPMLAKIIDWSIQNRMLVCVLAVVLGLSGIWSMRTISLDAIPDLSDVQVIVHTDWMGRDPQTVEDQITYPISSALLNVAQVRDVRGRSGFGMSFVYVIFDDGTDPYWARSRVLENLSQVQRSLPPGVTPSLGPDASGVGWVYLYTLEDTRGVLDLGQLRELQDYYVRYQLSSVPGVAEGSEPGWRGAAEYQVTVDPRALTAYGRAARAG